MAFSTAQGACLPPQTSLAAPGPEWLPACPAGVRTASQGFLSWPANGPNSTQRLLHLAHSPPSLHSGCCHAGLRKPPWPAGPRAPEPTHLPPGPSAPRRAPSLQTRTLRPPQCTLPPPEPSRGCWARQLVGGLPAPLGRQRGPAFSHTLMCARRRRRAEQVFPHERLAGAPSPMAGIGGPRRPPSAPSQATGSVHSQKQVPTLAAGLQRGPRGPPDAAQPRGQPGNRPGASLAPSSPCLHASLTLRSQGRLSCAPFSSVRWAGDTLRRAGADGGSDPARDASPGGSRCGAYGFRQPRPRWTQGWDAVWVGVPHSSVPASPGTRLLSQLSAGVPWAPVPGTLPHPRKARPPRTGSVPLGLSLAPCPPQEKAWA